MLARLALAFATLTWAGNFAVAELINDDIQPATISFFRWAIAFIFLSPMLFTNFKTLKPILSNHWKWLTLMAFTGASGFHCFAYLALEFTSMTNMSMIMGATPATVLVMSSLMHGEKHSPIRITGVGLCFLGIGVLVLGRLTTPNIGDLIGVMAMPFWAFYVASLKDMPEGLNSTTLTALVSIPATLLIAPVAIGETIYFGLPTFSTEVILGVIYAGAIASGLAYLTWSYGVEKLGPPTAAPFMNLVPIFGVTIAVTLMNETLSWNHIIAAVLILLGLVLSGWHKPNENPVKQSWFRRNNA